jgi:cytochrome c-type biogenesis protein CcsB
MKKIIGFLFSGTLMGILLLVFAISIGYATFIENDFTAAAAKQIVYNSHWFELVVVLMAVNFTGMIFTKKLYRRSKLNLMMIHISWVVIIIGAGITRYFGFEGKMHIRNNETTNQVLTSDVFVNAIISGNNEKLSFNDKVILAPLNKIQYRKRSKIAGKDIELSVKRYIPNAVKTLKPDPSGQSVLDLVVASGSMGRQGLILPLNETAVANGVYFNFGDSIGQADIQFISGQNGLLMRSKDQLFELNMKTGDTTKLPSGEFITASPMKLFATRGVLFVIRQLVEKAVIAYEPGKAQGMNNEGDNYVEIGLKVDKEEKNFTVSWSKEEILTLNNVTFDLNIGEQLWTIPFSLKLNRFEMTRYPGSQSPSSFASEITLIDPKNNVNMPYRIFMNNILSYKGYRFYQSSYDQDENGTILSVNLDYWGTTVTYIGYIMLFTTLILAFFMKNNRFAKLTGLIREIHLERKKLVISALLLLIPFLNLRNAAAQDKSAPPVIDKKQAALFGKLLMQSNDGRIIPINTTSNNVLVKIYKKSSYDGLTADQVFLGMAIFTEEWKKMPIIKVSDKSLRETLGIKGNYASFNDFFNQDDYVIGEDVNAAYQKSPATRTTLEKELLAVDERVNVCQMAFSGSLLKIYPVPFDKNNSWIGIFENSQLLQQADPIYVKNRFQNYAGAVKTAVLTGDYAEANSIVQAIDEAQHQYGKALIPSDFKVNLEVFYNNANIFKRLFPVYMMVGIILLGLFLLQLFWPAYESKRAILLLTVILIISFAFHTIGLLMRWYIAGHAPWSNGYESMIYIAWAIVLAGILFRKTSLITLSITSILAGITLLTAHMSWLNPEITNLVPVLKSYWLTIHVATITASYGFLALGSMLGFLNLVLMIFRTKNNIQRVGMTITEISYIIEMTLMAGLVLLTIGTFLGGVWANESWGRYWGWDPKETWSLVTIIIYSFILHMNLVPSLKTRFTLNFFALIGFGSVLMTYFGVNYYLSGLHSYAQGDPVAVPSFVYYILGVIFIISVFAAASEIRFTKESSSAVNTGDPNN